MEFLSQDLYNYDFFNPEVLNPNLSPYFNPMGMFGSLGLASGNIPGFVTTDALDVSDPLVRNIAGGTADPSVYNSMLDGAAIMATVEQNLAAQRNNFEVPVEDVIGPTDLSRLEDTTGIFAEIFGGMGRTDLLETGGELLQRIAELAAEGRPVAPADLPGLVNLSQEDAEAFLEAINQYNEQQETETDEVDIAEEDTIEAVDSELADTTTTTEDAEPIPDYSEFVNPRSAPAIASPPVGTTPPSSLPPSSPAPTRPMTPPPGSAGVIIDIEDLMNAGDWTVFLPGVIPGLPSSPTIIGTVEEILSNPSGIFDDLLEDLEGIVTNPEQVLEDILNDAADSDGLITIGGIQSVISDVMDRIQEGPEAPPATIATEQDPTIIGGEDKDEDEEVSESISQEPPAEEEPDVTPEPIEPTEPPAVESVEPTTEPPAVESVEPTTEPPAVESVEPQPEVGTVTTTTLPPDSPEPQPEVGFDDTKDAVSAGGGGILSGKPFETDGVSQYGIAYQTPQLRQVVVPKKDYVAELDALIERSLFGRMI